jgi:hypothetical protein
LVTLASIAAIVLVYLGRHGKGPLRHVDLSGHVGNIYLYAGFIAVLGIVVPLIKPKGKTGTEEQPLQGQQQFQAPPQGQQPPSQYPQQPPYDPNRPS